jgi:hypothetical protein
LRHRDVDEALLEQSLLTRDCPPVDLLVRTSGEVRLSDFLMWQSSFSHYYFTQVLWPEFSFGELAWAVLQFQIHAKDATARRALVQQHSDPQATSPDAAASALRKRKFLDSLYSARDDACIRAANTDADAHS